MNRILIIGCPGSGKSTLAKKLSQILNLPLLHLDRIYHIDNYHQIPRSELITLIQQFIANHDSFIIDGNYSATLELRMKHADTIIFFDIPTDICLKNVLARIQSGEARDDIAPGFDNSILHEDFIEYVRDFKTIRQPYIEQMISKFDGKIIRITNYSEMENLCVLLENNQA